MDPATPEISPFCHTLSLHAALPILADLRMALHPFQKFRLRSRIDAGQPPVARRDMIGEHGRHSAIFGADLHDLARICDGQGVKDDLGKFRSEEHTSELQSLMRISYAVFCLKKKKNNNETKEI